MHVVNHSSSYKLILVDLKDPSDRFQYTRSFEHLDNSNLFHSPELLLCATPENEGTYAFILQYDPMPIVILPFNKTKLIIKDSDQPFFDVTSPYGYSGPLFNPNHVSFAELNWFWNQIDNWYSKNNVITEFIRFSLENNHLGYTGEITSVADCVVGAVLDKESQWNSFKPKVRNNVRKARRDNCHARVMYGNISAIDIDIFHDIYTKTMSRVDATSTYFFPKSMFKSLIEIHPENCILTTVYKGTAPISTELGIIVRKTLYSFLGGTLKDYFKTRPNDFLKYSLLEWCRSNGIKHYVLGGGKQKNDSLYQYKKRFFPNDKDKEYLVGKKIINHVIFRELNECLAMSSAQQSNELHDFFPPYRKQ